MIENITTEKTLKEYVEGNIQITPILNIWMNDHSRDWYAELGNYVVGKPNPKKTIRDYLSFSNKKDKGSFVGIMFITSLEVGKLKSAFGQPLKHSEFGEGFVPSRKYTFESYFLRINGGVYHIGRDHRGTSFEVPRNYTSEQIFEDVKEFVREYSK